MAIEEAIKAKIKWGVLHWESRAAIFLKAAELASGPWRARFNAGSCDDSLGYFVEPTIILTTNPLFKTMEEEIFGPVLTIFVYQDENYPDTLKLCDSTSKYGLSGTNDKAGSKLNLLLWMSPRTLKEKLL